MDSSNTNIESWVDQYTGPMLDWAVKKTGDQELAQDLVQDTFLSAYQKIDRFEGRSSAKTWLFSILNNKIIDYYRKKGREATTGLDNLSNYFNQDGEWQKNLSHASWGVEESHLLDNTEFVKVLEACLEELPEQWRLSIRFKYLTEKKGEQICQELEITPTNFWQIIRRAKLRLRDCIEINWSRAN
jgi:RNA polymerase sigma-70 factor (TIGR02943 family)